MNANKSNESLKDVPRPNFDGDSDDDSNFSSSNHLQNYFYITPDKLALYLSDPTSHSYDFIQLLDARFNYEYNGGKILSAINITLFSALVNIFARFHEFAEEGKSICFVIYCEFSSERGPKLYDRFRDFDRHINMANHPKLTFPNLFLLEGGYNKFYNLHPNFCCGKYVQMYDQEFIKNDMIKLCKRNYFADYKEFLKMKQDPNLKLDFKFNSGQKEDSEQKNDVLIESQPSIGPFNQ